MPITLQRSELYKFFVGIILSLVFWGEGAAEQGCSWTVKTGIRPAIELSGKKIKLERTLAATLKAADEAEFLPMEFSHGLKAKARWLVVRTSSRVRGDAGFCGAGHEDKLILIDVDGAMARPVDDFLVQSCLKSITMDADQFNELITILNQNPTDGSMNFQQFLSGEANSVQRGVFIKVINGRAKIELKQVSPSF